MQAGFLINKNMKKQKMIDLFTGLNQVGNVVGQKFGYAISRNIDILKPEMDRFEEAKGAIIKNYSKKDEAGKPMKDDKGFVIDNQEEADKEYKALLQEEVDIKLYQINLSVVPESITAAQFNGIFPIILEDGK